MAIKKHLMLALFSLAIALAGTTTHHQVAAAASGQETYDIGFEPDRPAHRLVWQEAFCPK